MQDLIIKIPHLDEIKEIREIEKNICKETGVSVCDISHWNSGKEYQTLILSKYQIHHPLNILDYHYSYEYHNNLKQSVMSRLIGSSISQYTCVFIHNATAAICCIADYLKKHNYKKICVLEPAYFSVYSCLQSFGLNVQKEDILLNDKEEPTLPYDDLIKEDYDVIWITSPIFSTGIYFEQSQIDDINNLAQKGVLLIIDESASTPNHTLFNQLYPMENLITIFSPHKYLAINSIKFAAIICTSSIGAYLEDWIDVFAGALPISTCAAIEHFLSPNFNLCMEIHDKYIKNNIHTIQSLCKNFPDNHFRGIETNYITLCNKALPCLNTFNKLNMFHIIKHTYVSFIPGYINDFSERWGFCFRVNLTLDTAFLKNSLGRLFNYFSNKYQ